MSEKLRTSNSGHSLIASDWITAIGMALLFVVIAFLLGWSIRDLLLDKVGQGVLQHVRAAWLDGLTNLLGVVYCCLFAYSFPGKFLKVAFLLLCAKYLAQIAMPYLHASVNVRHSTSVAGAIVSQIAYAIILIAIAQWFKTVLQPDRSTDPGVSSA